MPGKCLRLLTLDVMFSLILQSITLEFNYDKLSSFHALPKFKNDYETESVMLMLNGAKNGHGHTSVLRNLDF